MNVRCSICMEQQCRNYFHIYVRCKVIETLIDCYDIKRMVVSYSSSRKFTVKYFQIIFLFNMMQKNSGITNSYPIVSMLKKFKKP